MPYNKTDFPVSLKNLPAKVKNKAVDIIKALLEEGYPEGKAIAIGTWKAEKMYNYKPLNKRKKSTVVKGVMRTYCYMDSRATTEAQQAIEMLKEKNPNLFKKEADLFENEFFGKKKKKMKGKDPCWDGYEMIGLKPDGNPNCVPKKKKKASSNKSYFDGSYYKFDLEIPTILRKELLSLFERSDRLLKNFLLLKFDQATPKTNKAADKNDAGFFMDWAGRTYDLIKMIPEGKETAIDLKFLKDGRVCPIEYKKIFCSALQETHKFFLNIMLSQKPITMDKKFVNENFIKIVKKEVEKYLTLKKYS